MAPAGEVGASNPAASTTSPVAPAAIAAKVGYLVSEVKVPTARDDTTVEL